MKPIEVEFASRGPALVCVWALAGAVCLGALLATASILVRQNERLAQVREEIRVLREEQTRNSAYPRVSQVQTADTARRRSALLAAARHLHTDLNPIFAVIEQVDVPGAQLVRMAFEAAGTSDTANGIRLEYALDSMQKVAAVSAALNDGERRDWQLESAEAVNGGVRGAWRYVGR